jgi:hypothetical protein
LDVDYKKKVDIKTLKDANGLIIEDFNLPSLTLIGKELLIKVNRPKDGKKQ